MRSSDERRQVPRPNVVSTQSAKYDNRNASIPPPKPQRTFREMKSVSSEDLCSKQSADLISTSNDDLSRRIVECVRSRNFWIDAEPELSLFANPFDDLSGAAQCSSSSRETELIEESMKHEHFSIFVRGHGGSGKSVLVERLFLKVLDSHSSPAHRATGHAVITALRPLMRYASGKNPIASLAELSFQFAYDGVKVARASISRSAISIARQPPLILTLITSGMSAKEKDFYRISGLEFDSNSIFSGLSLDQFRRALNHLSISTLEVEKVLCAFLLIRSLQVDCTSGLIDTTHHSKNIKNLVNASSLLGVSPNSLKKVVESSNFRDQNLSGTRVVSSLILEALIDYLIEHANSLLDDNISQGKESPTESASSTADSGIEIAKSSVTRIEVESTRIELTVEEVILKKSRRLMSLFSHANCQSSFALRMFSTSSPPLRMQSRQTHREHFPHQSIICLRTNDDCEYMRPDFQVIKKQLQAFRKRIDDTAPELPVKDY